MRIETIDVIAVVVGLIAVALIMGSSLSYKKGTEPPLESRLATLETAMASRPDSITWEDVPGLEQILTERVSAAVRRDLGLSVGPELLGNPEQLED